MINVAHRAKVISVKHYYILPTLLFVFSLFFIQAVKADGVFLEKKKDEFKLSGADLNRIKAEYQIRFGQKTSSSYSYQSNNPWEKKKSGKLGTQTNKSIWAECRDYSLHKRNRCYREGRDAFSCEQMYEARVNLCDTAP